MNIATMVKTVVVVLVVVSAACSQEPTQVPEISFCDTKYEYSVYKVEENKYMLFMEIGNLHPWSKCDSNNRRRYVRTSIERSASSEEEALKLMEEYRKQSIASEEKPSVTEE